MADANLTFNTPENQTIARETLIALLNVATDTTTPKWVPVGIRVSDSSAEYEWNLETIQDILGNTYSTMKKPTVTQSFDDWGMTAGDEALLNVWNDAVRKQDAQSLANKDMLIVHKYAGTNPTAMFAERYNACALQMTNLGGPGGGNMSTSLSITYGGERTTGTASLAAGTFTFKADSDL